MAPPDAVAGRDGGADGGPEARPVLVGPAISKPTLICEADNTSPATFAGVVLRDT